MMYVVKWTENGKRRQLNCLTREFAVVMFNRIIVDCHHYDAVLHKRKG
jgi:hypothetical protein